MNILANSNESISFTVTSNLVNTKLNLICKPLMVDIEPRY